MLVKTSFFARYTRDIVAFANTHTDGKVISVLEGGYSDRALTSASMGHVLGLLDQPGQPDWWSEAELHNVSGLLKGRIPLRLVLQIEKATKKKRTGRIAPFPSEMSSFPYLARTHILLTHFEGVPSEASNLSTSATTTPQPSSRMTLRNRGRAANGEEGSPMAARRQTRGTPRMKANTPSSGAPIETKDVMSASPMKPIIVTSPELSTPETKSPLDGAQRTNAADNSALHDVTIGVESVRLDTPVKERDDSRAFAAEALLSLVAPLEAGSDPTSNSPPESSLKPPVCLPMSGQDQSSREHQALATQPKIILRIPRPSPPPPGDTPGHAPVAQQEQKPIYPFLLHAPNKIPEERRLSYRESSAVTTSSDPTSDTEGEYASAQSGLSGGERAAKETSVETNVSEEQ